MTANDRSNQSAHASGQARPNSRKAGNPARFKLLYESADRRFCLFQDDEGHLTSVRSSKLA